MAGIEIVGHFKCPNCGGVADVALHRYGQPYNDGDGYQCACSCEYDIDALDLEDTYGDAVNAFCKLFEKGGL